MIAVTLDSAQVKGFMGQMLREDVFDEFEVRGVEIGLDVRISINGVLEVEVEDEVAADTQKVQGFSTWAALRPLVYTIIKTGQKPKLIKIVFSYKAQNVHAIHPNAAALFLNMIYENDNVHFTTATSQKEFALDKSLDNNWDDWMRAFFAQKNITITDRE